MCFNDLNECGWSGYDDGLLISPTRLCERIGAVVVLILFTLERVGYG